MPPSWFALYYRSREESWLVTYLIFWPHIPTLSVYDVTDIDCWAQNGSTPVVFCDCQTSIFNKQDQIYFSYVPINMAHDASSILFP